LREFNILVVGVGGQGALLASNILAEVGILAGYDVKKAEVHGMSQRGGSVNSHVRWGRNVKSPVIGDGEVDILFSLEKLETLRYLKMVRRGGLIVIGEFAVPPLTVSSGEDHYPDDVDILRLSQQVTEDVVLIPSLKLAEESGSARAHNVVLIGALSERIREIPVETWSDSIKSLVPSKYKALNQKAFLLGRDAVRRV
jgi:indolepyruvate ferredoxin oxidoreductase beta subunit